MIAERKPPATLGIGALPALTVIGMAALSAVLAAFVVARDSCSSNALHADPSADAKRSIPVRYLRLYGVDGKDIYDPDDAIPSAAGYLSELARRARGNLEQAILGYNHSPAYVTRRARARPRVRARD